MRSTFKVPPIGASFLHCKFDKKHEKELHALVEFFREYATRYRYKYIGIRDNKKLNGTQKFKQIYSNTHSILYKQLSFFQTNRNIFLI